MCRAVTAGDRLRARGDVAVNVSVRVNHVVVDESPLSRRIYWLLWTNKDLDRRTVLSTLLTLMQIVPHILSRFNISNTRLLALQCSNTVKPYHPHNSNRVFNISRKCIFNDHQITTLQAENLTFFRQGHGQKVTIRMHQKTPFPV